MEKRISTVATLSAPSFSVYLDEVRLKTGEVTKRIRVDHPEAAAVVPFVSDKEIIMVRQYRYALGRETLEIPAGKADPGESVRACASRELQEETGFRAEELTHLYTFAPAIGYSNELIHIYSAKKMVQVSDTIDEREIGSVEIVPIKDLLAMVRDKYIFDGKTLIALALAGVYLS
jgi:ADP-ribose pyrophosphatase